MTHAILLAVVGFVGGAFGSMVGLGGGVFIVPALALFLGVPIHQAIAASLMAVVATSTTAAVAYLRDDLTNVRLGMTLETMTVTGALVGGSGGRAAQPTSALGGVRRRHGAGGRLPAVPFAHEWSGPLKRRRSPGVLGASYYDRSLGSTVTYRVQRLPAGMGASLVAGVVSGLLGVGGGFLKVPVMVLAMRVPVRAAVCTSSFMIGVTACTGARRLPGSRPGRPGDHRPGGLGRGGRSLTWAPGWPSG